MELTPRIKQILQMILEEEQPILEQQIADRIGVSKRTVQREFEYMESGLKEYHLSLKKKKNAGVWLEGDAMSLTALREALGEVKGAKTADKEIRRKYLICELLRERIPKKLYYFSELLGVSEATISNDLEYVAEWFGANHLEVIRKPGFGVTLAGTEKDYRAALQQFINENVDDASIRMLLYKNGSTFVEAVSDFDSKNIYELLNSEILGKVSRTLQEMDEPRLRQMADNSYIGLILHITIAIDRIFKGEIIESKEDAVYAYKMDEDYALAQEIISRLEEHFDLNIPTEEMAYILLHIKGSKMSYSDRADESHLMGTEGMLDMVDQMIDAFDASQAYELKCDEEFIQGLLMHLEPTLIRLKNDMNIYNPLLEEIKEEYSSVFQRCEYAAKVITEMTGKVVPESEIGYLAMHFGAALVRASDRKEVQRTVEIGVICASGFGVARLMMTKLKNSLKQDVILHTYGRDEITPYITSKTDFFVSSLILEEPGMDSVKVSPLITATDLALIRAKVEEYSHMPPKQQENDFTRQLDEINATAAEIKNLIRRYKNYKISAGASLDEILSILSKKVTEQPMGAAVLKADLLEREQIMSQIFPDMKFALFHCRTRVVQEAVFYTATPDEGNCFSHPEMKQIYAAVVLLMPQGGDRVRDTEILGHISSSFVEDEKFLQTIFAGKEDKVREKLQKILKSYFNEYISRM